MRRLPFSGSPRAICRSPGGAGLLVLLLLLLSQTPGLAQYKKIVGVTGTSLAGTSFTLQIDAAPSYVRSIDFVSLPTEYPPLAMASLMASAIEDDYFANGKTGFRAGKVMVAEESSEFDAVFEIRCTAPINQIRVGMLGNPNVPLPRAPGVAFNPNIIHYDADLPTPLLGPQPSHPNATFRVNGYDPSGDFFRRVSVQTDTVMNWQIETGANPNQWITVLGGPYNPGILTANWGEYLDLGVFPYVNGLPGGIFVVGDGIFQSTGSFLDSFFRSDASGQFNFAITVPSNLSGANVGLQALVTDPTAIFPFFRFSNAVNVDFDDGQDFSVTPATDGFVPVMLSQGRTFDFYGATYSNLFVYENGFVSFGTPGPIVANIDPALALSGPPSIFVNWADWDLSASSIRVREFKDRLIINWGSSAQPLRHNGDVDQSYFVLQLALNQPLVADASAGAILLEYPQLDPAAVGGNDAIIGLSPGMNLDTAATALDLGSSQFGLSQNSALLAQTNRQGAAVSSLSVAAGNAPVYSNGSNLNGRDIGIFPAQSGLGPLSNRPFSIASSPNPDDVQGVVGNNSIAISAGAGQQLLLSGYFKNLFTLAGPMQTAVVLDPLGVAGVGPIPLQIDGVLSSQPGSGGLLALPLQPGFRDFEGLVVSTPQTPLPTGVGPVDLLLRFGSGRQFLLPLAVTVVP